ncbi:unnamed protein product [Parascedosporium putredinis]|uniref:Fungal N-terminal domain-containing protein n=1 Tax=Parascedosporium putredinis TaxID=1442378 RepID=A0A9P1H312_9PEZI|nr:unnamed protein product [Parascedosporium putredinis]CAI7994224.1 unnamed protein product [Parascedosporium putredinis]
MDPATAIGVASGIITFLNVACKIVDVASELYTSNSGATKENERISQVITDLKDVSLGLTANTPVSGRHEAALQELGRDCAALSAELLSILENLRLAKSRF